MTACKHCRGRGWVAAKGEYTFADNDGVVCGSWREQCFTCHGTGKDPQAAAVLQAQRAMIAALWWRAGEHACIVAEYAGHTGWERSRLYHADLASELILAALDMEAAQ